MNHLDQIVAAQKRGEINGIMSVCSAHPLVLETVLENGKLTSHWYSLKLPATG